MNLRYFIFLVSLSNICLGSTESGTPTALATPATSTASATTPLAHHKNSDKPPMYMYPGAFTPWLTAKLPVSTYLPNSKLLRVPSIYVTTALRGAGDGLMIGGLQLLGSSWQLPLSFKLPAGINTLQFLGQYARTTAAAATAICGILHISSLIYNAVCPQPSTPSSPRQDKP